MKKFYKIKEDSELGKRISNRKNHFDKLTDELINFIANYTNLDKSAFKIDNFLDPVVKEEYKDDFKNLLKKYGIQGYKYFKENSKIYKEYKKFLGEVEIEGLKYNEIRLNAKDIDMGFGLFGCGYCINYEKSIICIDSNDPVFKKRLAEVISECLIEIDELEYHKIRLEGN